MISDATLQAIRRQCQEYWDAEVHKDYFRQTAQGKEIGHRVADLIDDKTSALLTVHHITRRQFDRTGKQSPRSMGDIWLEAGGLFHPVNVKAGITGSEGQPNMVSMKKLLNGLIERQIDSYYLLMVKLEIADGIKPKVYLTDMLDHLDYVTFDSGPGQIMLKSGQFFKSFDPEKKAEPKTTRHKVETLLRLMEDGERRLRINRERDLTKYQQNVREYLSGGHFAVTPETQKGLRLQ